MGEIIAAMSERSLSFMIGVILLILIGWLAMSTFFGKSKPKNSEEISYDELAQGNNRTKNPWYS